MQSNKPNLDEEKPTEEYLQSQFESIKKQTKPRLKKMTKSQLIDIIIQLSIEVAAHQNTVKELSDSIPSYAKKSESK